MEELKIRQEKLEKIHKEKSWDGDSGREIRYEEEKITELMEAYDCLLKYGRTVDELHGMKMAINAFVDHYVHFTLYRIYGDDLKKNGYDKGVMYCLFCSKLNKKLKLCYLDRGSRHYDYFPCGPYSPRDEKSIKILESLFFLFI